MAWINGPFSASSHPDLWTVREDLVHALNPGEHRLAGGGRSGGNQRAATPTGRSAEEQRAQGRARARHETVNSRFKVFGVLKQQHRHKLEDRSEALTAVASVAQLATQCGLSPLFQNDHEEEALPQVLV